MGCPWLSFPCQPVSFSADAFKLTILPSASQAMTPSPIERRVAASCSSLFRSDRVRSETVSSSSLFRWRINPMVATSPTANKSPATIASHPARPVSIGVMIPRCHPVSGCWQCATRLGVPFTVHSSVFFAPDKNSLLQDVDAMFSFKRSVLSGCAISIPSCLHKKARPPFSWFTGRMNFFENLLRSTVPISTPTIASFFLIGTAMTKTGRPKLFSAITSDTPVRPLSAA